MKNLTLKKLILVDCDKFFKCHTCQNYLSLLFCYLSEYVSQFANLDISMNPHASHIRFSMMKLKNRNDGVKFWLSKAKTIFQSYPR
jgi:hypothetical protein